MRARDFFSQLEHDKIVGAIRESESKMCGEIRIFISRKEPEDAVVTAQRRFEKLGMTKTTERNGVLIYVAPRVRKFAIIGDVAIHQKCGDNFWKEVAHEMSDHFRKADFTGGIIHAIRRAGALMAEHFPRQAGGKNQLSDEIEHD
ncbi:MAG: TPM domain-containing protein [Limisphaerales bacterium]